MAVLNLMEVLTIGQKPTDRFLISCKQGNYPFLNMELGKKRMCVYFLMKISNRVGRSIFFFSFLYFYTPPHFSGEVLCYTLRCLSVCPCSSFPIDNLSIYSQNFFKFCIHIVIGDEWYGIVNGQNPSIFNGVTALFRIGKMVSGLLFLYCS